MQHLRYYIDRWLLLLFVVVLLVPLAGSWVYHPQSVAAQEPPPYDAAFVSQHVPAAMEKGTRSLVSVTVRNTGSLTWTHDAGFKLGSQNPADNAIWNIGRVTLAPGERVASGQPKTFTFEVQAPAETGTYNFQWQMLQEGVRWFGEPSPNVAVEVVDALPEPAPSPPESTVPTMPYEEIGVTPQRLAPGLLQNDLLRRGNEALRAIEKPAPPPHGDTLALALVDPEYFAPYEPARESLVPIAETSLPTQKSWILISPLIVGDLQHLIDAARSETGYHLAVRSAYRSAATQQWLFQDLARQYGPYALLSGARAGHSEHQLGTTVDVLPRGHSFATFPPELADWLTANAHRYGFVVSYQTGVAPDHFQYRDEPWHLRWLGPALAAEVHASGVSLDTYLRTRYYGLAPYQAPAPIQDVARVYGYVQ